MNTRFMKSLGLATTAAVILLTSGTAIADVVKVDVGPTINPFFLRLACDQVATDRGGRVVKTERDGSDKTGVCYIDIPKPAGITATPGNPQSRQQQPVQPAVQIPGTRLEMAGVGRLWSQDHATERCRALAIRKNAEWTGTWKKHDTNNEAQCQLRFTIKPDFELKAVDAGRIWNDAHAQRKCPRVAKRNNGTWSGEWKKAQSSTTSAVCMVKIKAAVEPETVVKRFKTTKIWNDAHAKQRCNQLAQENNGQWLGVWRKDRTGKGSICMIKVAADAGSATPSDQQSDDNGNSNNTQQSGNTRSVKAGAIWDNAHAQRKCPVVASNAKGRWTKRWKKTGPGNESVCEVAFDQPNNNGTTQTTAPATPPTPATNNTRTRNVAAGPIWDDNQAKNKCPVVAANNKAKWTGNWTKTGPGHISVCEISVVVANNSTPTQSPPTQTSQTGTIIEIPAPGGLWDQSQADRKCPMVATDNKGRWTGSWRKTGSDNAAVCQIDTRR